MKTFMYNGFQNLLETIIILSTIFAVVAVASTVAVLAFSISTVMFHLYRIDLFTLALVVFGGWLSISAICAIYNIIRDRKSQKQ